MVFSVTTLIFAGVYLAEENDWKAFSLMKKEKGGKGSDCRFLGGEVSEGRIGLFKYPSVTIFIL